MMDSAVQSKTVGEYVMENPSLSRVFQQFGIDFCCGGKRLLQDVCESQGIEMQVVLNALAAAPAISLQNETLNWQTARIGEMIDHIYSVHHQYLYDELPRLATMMEKVVRAHGERDARLSQLACQFDVLRAELLMHLQKEEQILFPYSRQLENALSEAGELPLFHCGHIGNPIRVMELEHDHAGEFLVQLRALSDNYTPPEWACNTYRALLSGLAEMEADLHRHIHEENNILFPRVLKLVNG